MWFGPLTLPKKCWARFKCTDNVNTLNLAYLNQISSRIQLNYWHYRLRVRNTVGFHFISKESCDSETLSGNFGRTLHAYRTFLLSNITSLLFKSTRRSFDGFDQISSIAFLSRELLNRCPFKRFSFGFERLCSMRCSRTLKFCRRLKIKIACF